MGRLIVGGAATWWGAAQSLRILYGGSATPDNIAGLLEQKDVDGGLVGGAALKAGDFARMVKTAVTYRK